MQGANKNITEHAKKYAAQYLGCDTDDLELASVGGGYSRNRRSIVGYAGQYIFVKEVDVTLLPDAGFSELGWLKKEAGLTRYLFDQGLEEASDWSYLSDDGKVLLLPAYRKEDGWLWEFPSDASTQNQYINAVIHATKDLETATFSPEAIEQYILQPFFRNEIALNGGYDLIIENEAARLQIADKLQTMIANDKHDNLKDELAQVLELVYNPGELKRLRDEGRKLIHQPNSCFGHCDVRSDNLTYHPESGRVKLVDWNWASMTPANFGSVEFLLDAARRGIDVEPWREHLDWQQLVAIVGYYLRKCIKDPLQPGDTLREMQAETAAVAYSLYTMCRTD